MRWGGGCYEAFWIILNQTIICYSESSLLFCSTNRRVFILLHGNSQVLWMPDDPQPVMLWDSWSRAYIEIWVDFVPIWKGISFAVTHAFFPRKAWPIKTSISLPSLDRKGLMRKWQTPGRRGRGGQRHVQEKTFFCALLPAITSVILGKLFLFL